MVEPLRLRQHSRAWYDALAKVQKGYYYPWKSEVAPGNGEDAYLAMVREHLTPDSDVLEVGCGHGEVALQLAPLCRSIIAYDRVEDYIEIAKKNAADRNIRNVTFLCYDGRDPASGEIRLPVEDRSIDMITVRRGPHYWIEDAPRIARPAAVLIQLDPMEEPIPAWSSKLPHLLHYENSGRYSGQGSRHQSVENRLNQSGLLLHSGWGFDVPEVFPDPKELYTALTWGIPADQVPTFEDVEYKFKNIYERYAEEKGIVLRHCRFLWKSVVDIQ
ncbi:MAG: class I SAM-dependent methyltransferase [Pseudomonadales bacterium]|jgi:SAM-dependent methyltransferase|nr:class I SAM-dependent methyltransferase [Pseudomonadales bacterium]MDP7594096.1 class I SAM-dependent methyltransferase [Pseudomonadales bacterium]HJN50513.1 class I SAM-dependent methyltransferase [Pseudomonadales bacterium]|tara:strand:+ start:151 stop:969 length:819 start_codon:yes stop_codon:yes gene_type:complete